MKKGGLIFSLAVLLILSISLASAHQPRLVYDKDLSLNNSQLVKNPEISQAFYAELAGSSEYYKIVSNVSFNLYVQVLSPLIENANKDFIVEIYSQNALLGILNGTNFIWIKFHEPFANDDYWQGPDFNQSVPAGEYLFKVYNMNNKGKYVLVFGQIESFPFKEIINAAIAMPKLKMYFEKSPFGAYFNKIGLFLLIPLIIIIAIVVVILRKRSRELHGVKISKPKKRIFKTV